MTFDTALYVAKIIALIFCAFTLHATISLFYYAGIMAFMAARDAGRLTGHKVLDDYGYLALAIGYLLDASLNIVWGTLIFLRLPEDVLLTGRLIRYKREGFVTQTWQTRTANWICRELLDPLAPSGCHCQT